jgi:hypothetical protein
MEKAEIKEKERLKEEASFENFLFNMVCFI